MYNSLNKNISASELTAIIHYVVKILNKYRSEENRGIKLEDLPIIPEPKIFEVCDELLKEINIENIGNQDDKIDVHINSLFKILNDRLEKDNPTDNKRGKQLLEQFRKS